MIRVQDVVVFQGSGDERSALGPSISYPVSPKSTTGLRQSPAHASFQRNAGLFAIAREGCLSGLQLKPALQAELKTAILPTNHKKALA